MVQRRSNEIEPYHPGKTPPGSGLSTRKEWGISTLSLQTILTTKEVTYCSAWALYLYTLTSKSTNLCFIHICEVTEAQKLWSFPAAHLGATAWPSLAAPQGRKGPAEINRGESHSRTLGLKVFSNWRFFLISHIFNKVHWQLLYVALLKCLPLLSTHKGFLPNPWSFQIFGLCHTTAVLDTMRHSQGSLECFHMLNGYPALPTKEKNLDLKSLTKYYSITPWCSWHGARWSHSF